MVTDVVARSTRVGYLEDLYLFQDNSNKFKPFIPQHFFFFSLAFLIHMCACVCVCVCVFNHFSRVQLFVTPWTAACQASLSWDSPGKSTGDGCHFLLQGIFLTQGLNLHLLHLLH